MEKRKVKVAVGMSGGVDSSVAAFLLKKQGYDVVGYFMKLWHDPCGTGENACCDEKAQMDARKVAKELDIPFYVVDAREKFKSEVTDYFINEYRNLRTPNPCVVCNKKIKFGWLVEFAAKTGCDYLATGHYARIACKFPITNFQLPINPQISNYEKKKDQSTENYKLEIGNCYHLLKGEDSLKDQSYFLWQLNQDQLSKIIFPLGEMTKNEVRKIAKENNLPVAEKKESQEICFVEDNYRDFLRRNLSHDFFKPGRIVNVEGFTIGGHNGLINYTIGQRKGIEQHGVFGIEKEPLYVTGFNMNKNELIVGKEDELLRTEFEIRDINWLNPETEALIRDKEARDLMVKIRYRTPKAGCKVKYDSKNSCKVILSQPERAITPGQSAVFYLGDEMVGGGIIAS